MSEPFCIDCPDHEACATGWPCHKVKEIAHYHNQIQKIREEYVAKQAFHEHNPVQHRDGKPPWCRECGLTEDYMRPKSVFNKGQRHSRKKK